MTIVDHRQASGPPACGGRCPATLEMPEAFLRVCVLAWLRRRPPFPADRHEKDH
jgi:hypothetical protein